MKKITATPINPHSWILTEWGNRVGVLSSGADEFTLLANNGVQKFNNIETLQTTLGCTLKFETDSQDSEPVDRIDSLPTRHTNPQNIQQLPVVSYTRTSSSSMRFAAGYWGIQYAHGWVPGFCPRLDTLMSYPRIGPFSSKLELNTLLTKQNKA